MSEKKEKKKGGMFKKPDNFDELEKEFESVLNELLTDESLEKFRKEYEKLHEALINSHDSERRLMSKVRELNNEIAGNAEKVATALRLSKEDESTIGNLKLESEKAWKLVEYLQEKEVWSRETITTLRQEIDQLKALVEKSADLAVQFQNQEMAGFRAAGQSAAADEKSPSRTSCSASALAQKTPRGKGAGGGIGGGGGGGGHSYMEIDSVESLRKHIADMELEDSKLKNDIYQSQVDLRNRTLDLQRERNRRTKAEQELTTRTTELDEQKAFVCELKRSLDHLREQCTGQESNNRELRVTNERHLKEIENINANLTKTQQDYEKQSNTVDHLQMEMMDLQNDLRLKEDRLSKMLDNTKLLNKTKNSLERKLKILTEQRAVLRKEKETLEGQLQVAEKTIEVNRKTKEADEKHISNLMRERDVVNKNLIKQVHATEKQSNLVSLGEQTNRTMGQEIMGFRRESEKQRRIIVQLERERDRYISENGDLTLKIMKAMEELQVRDLQILDYQKVQEELESRLKVQQNLYEAVHQDRNMYSRQLIETQDEMNEMKNKLRVLDHQSHQLKEEVANREAAVVREHLECLRLEKERDSLVCEIQMLKHQLRDVEQMVMDLRTEERNLRKVIANSDEQIKRQKKQLDSIIGERDILGSQLVRRNDELSLLYQKIKLLQTLIKNGGRMYDQRIEDIRLLRLEVKRQRQQNRCLQKSVENVSSYKSELYSVHREVLHERARCAALENELSHPRQIHRWRGLEITDPSKFELLQKVQALQKRLISRTEEVVELERVLQEKDRLYLELRKVLERQPGPEVAKQVNSYQRAVKTKNRQLKCMVAELNMFETDNKASDYDNQRLEGLLNEMKKKYYHEKKLRQELQQWKNYTKPSFQGLPAIIPGKDEYTGGGFRVTKTE